MVKVIPAFWEQFGDVGYSEPGGGLTYHHNKTDEYYLFSESMSEEQVEELMERCVKENKDLIFDLVKNNRVVYKPGCLY